MSDEKKTGATLTLKARSVSKDDETSTARNRSGSRARRVEQMARQQGLEANKAASPTSAAPTPTEGRGQQPRIERKARAEQPGRPERGARGERTERSDRPARQDRGDRTERSASSRTDAPTRPARTGQFERARDASPRHAYANRPDSARTPPERRARPATRQILGYETVFQVFTPCPQGLEAALAEELQALGFEAQAGRAGCHLSADWHGIQRINLFSRLATRVLVKLSSAQVQTEDDILELARATPWERWFGPEHSLRVDTSAVRSPMKSLQYCNLRAKDGICDRLREREGARPDIDTVRPDARVHLFLDEHSATLYLDTSGESLFKRGWRLDKGEAPIRENLAAGMLALSGWQTDQALMDPFCGSGTILIEAAWKAMGMPPGIMRPFAFERLRHHDRQAWYAYKDQMRSQARQNALTAPLLGIELNPDSVAAARANASRAGLGSGQIQFRVGDACEALPPAESGWIVTNPPYGERLPTDDPELWSRWASHLKRHFSGWHVNAISNDMQLPQRMRLQPRRRHPLYNGALDCRLFSFDMVTERYEG